MSPADAGQRLRRLLAVLPWLAAQGGASLAEVSGRTGMEEPEVVALLELAACCGLPPYTPDRLIELIVHEDRVEADLGPLLARPLRFSPAEGFTLAAAARAILAVPGADPEGALAGALRKLESVLGDHRRVDIGLDEPAQLELVRRAASGHRRLAVEYYSASRDELTGRQVDPYAVYARQGHWYLDGFCHLAEDLRHFRVDRIRTARALEETFDAPAAREAPGEAFAPGPEVRCVRLAVPVEAAWLVESVPHREVVEGGDGRLEVVLEVGGTAWLERLLLQLGPGAEVLDPPDLFDVGPAAAARVLDRYREDDPV